MSSDRSSKVAVDLASGTAGGVAQILVGHPFDTVKVQLQRSSGHANPIDAVKQLVATQGVHGLYRGMGPPLCTVAVFNALLFGITGSLNRFVRPDGGRLTPTEAAFTGALAGIPVAVLATPTELLKCRHQAQGAAKPPPGIAYTLADARAGRVLYSGPLNALRLISKFEGGISGLFRGLIPTLAREVPGNGVYFGAYYWCKQRLAAAQGLDSPSQLGLLSLIVAGGVAGPAFWIPVLPIDTIKTRMQTDSPHAPQYRGMIDCARKIARAEGIGALFKGWQPCVARSIPANAVTFLVYEIVHTALTKLTT